MSGLESIARLLKPRSVAVIGASADAAKTAGRPVAYLRKHGFTGDIYPVNPRVHAIDGLRCYPDIASLPGVPDDRPSWQRRPMRRSRQRCEA